MLSNMIMTAEGTGFIDTVDFTAISDMAESLGGKAMPAIIAVLVITVGIKLVKKFGGKIG